MPKYLVVYNDLKNKIESEEYVGGEKLPSGEEFSEEYQCSILTVKRALDMLVNEGYIVRKRGAGSFVKKLNNDSQINGEAFAADYNKRKTLLQPDVTSIVHTFDIVKCDADIAEKLNIKPNEFVYHIIRIRLYKGDPRIVEYTWMPIRLIEGLELQDVEKSIYYYITKKLKLHIQSAYVSVTAVRPNEIEKEYLHMTDTDFVCEVEQTAYLDNSDIFEYSIARHIPQFFEFRTNIIKEFR